MGFNSGFKGLNPRPTKMTLLKQTFHCFHADVVS